MSRRDRIPASAISVTLEREALVEEHVILAMLTAARMRAYRRDVEVSPLPTAYVLWKAGRSGQPIREVARGIELASRGQVPAFLARAVLKAIAGLPPSRLMDAEVEDRCRYRIRLAFRMRRSTSLRRTALAIAAVTTAPGDRHGHHQRLPLAPRDCQERLRFGDGSQEPDQRGRAQGDVRGLPGGDRDLAPRDRGDAQVGAGGAHPAADRAAPLADARALTAAPAVHAHCACGCGLVLWPVGTAIVHRVLGGARVAAWIKQDCELVPVRFADGEYGAVRRCDVIAECP